MENNLKYICPDTDCNGEPFILYKSKEKQTKNINFNCTTDTYFKPDILKCKKCKITYSDLIYNFKENELDKMYNDVIDEKYISQIKFKDKYFRNLKKKINLHLDENKEILEIGSYYGVFGNILKPTVKSYTGLELSKHGVEYSKNKFNLQIYNETLEQHETRNIKYDVVIMADVIEHFSNPFKMLSIVRKLLKKNGIFIATTFNIDSFYSKIRGYNYHWIIPFHLFFFSNTTMKNIGNKNNLDLFKIKNDPRYVSFGYLLEKLKFIFPRFKIFFNFLIKLKFLNNLPIKVNLGDLNIYFFKATN